MHPHKILITCCGIPAEIDLDLVPVCQAIWAHGIHTQWCCQGDGGGDATIAFPDIGEADRFGQLAFGIGRMHEMAQRGEKLPDQPPPAKWKIWTIFRFPMPQRAVMSVQIPRADLPWLTEWLAGAPHEPLETRPLAEPCGVSADAGKVITADEKRCYDEVRDAMEVLEALEDGQCYCEPSDDGEGSDHEADCPRNYDHLATAEDVVAFQRVIDHWAQGAHTEPEVIHGMRVGVTARAIELGLAEVAP